MTPDQLPADSKAVFVALLDATADAQALMHATLQRAKQAEGKLLMAQQVLDTAPSEQRQHQAITELVSAQAELQQLRAQQDARMERHATLSQIVTRVKGFVQTLPDDTVLDPVTVKAIPLRDESLTAAIQRIRTDIATAQHNLLQVQAAPLPLSDTKAAVTAFVHELAQRGKPAINIDHGHFDASWWGWQPGQPAHLAPPHLLQLIAWLDPDTLTARLLAQVDALPKPKLALSQADKQRRTADITATIEQLERQEECLIQQASALGQDVLRRVQANPSAILGVRVAQRKAVAA